MNIHKLPLMLLLLTCLGWANGDGVDWKAELNKSTYFEGEPILLEVWINNQTASSFTYYLSDYENMFLFDGEGNRLQSAVVTCWGDGHNIEPYSSHYTASDLADKYGSGNLHLLPVGEYHIRLRFREKSDLVHELNIKFEVLPLPKAFEREMLKYLGAITSREHSRNAKQYLTEFVEDYPDHPVLMPLALNRLTIRMKYTKESTSDKYFAICDRLLTSYESHLYAKMTLFNLARYFEQKDECKAGAEYFRKVSKRLTNPELLKLINETYLPKFE